MPILYTIINNISMSKYMSKIYFMDCSKIPIVKDINIISIILRIISIFKVEKIIYIFSTEVVLDL